VLSRAHQALQETEAAILREWEALETEHQRLGDWRTQLEERTKAASCQFASDRLELEQEREDLKEDLEKVFEREREVTREERRLAKKKEHLDQRETVITEFHEKLKAYNVMLEKQRDEQTATEVALQKLRQELDDTASNICLVEENLKAKDASVGAKAKTLPFARCLRQSRCTNGDNDWQTPPFVRHAEGRRPMARSPHFAVSPNTRAHVQSGPS
jgi:DNA repair exonuclease SbcCD ATPase subunit